MRISVDFDGVICKRDGFPRKSNFRDCPPMDNAKEAVDYLSKKYELYICTNRPADEWIDIGDWLEKYNFPVMTVTNKKYPDTIAYIDDRAIRFTSWLDVSKYFT